MRGRKRREKSWEGGGVRGGVVGAKVDHVPLCIIFKLHR